MTLEEIALRKAEIMATLEQYEHIPEEEFEKLDFAKNKEHFKLFDELAQLSRKENILIRQN